ncbi:hypothetical protein PUN28_013755 [Cardiocondyla obscurior]|uniref:Uncharacterized protein n=1 Tax=Cardiocondyla obscurior TaxID=286306 RepID=A0AAW2F730_9HYME
MYIKHNRTFGIPALFRDVTRYKRSHCASDVSNEAVMYYAIVSRTKIRSRTGSLARLGCSMGNAVVKRACHTRLILFTTAFRDRRSKTEREREKGDYTFRRNRRDLGEFGRGTVE